MSRKRKSDDPSFPDNTSDTIESDAAGAATSVAEPPALGDAHEGPVPEGSGRSFAERVGQKQRTTFPDPFGIATDNLAGVRLFESKHDRQMAIKFGDGKPEDKPSDVVIALLKEAGYRWDPRDRVWTYPVGGNSAMSTRIEAEQLYQEIRERIREEKGIAADPEIPI